MLLPGVIRRLQPGAACADPAGRRALDPDAGLSAHPARRRQSRPIREESALARSRDGRYAVDGDRFATAISDRTRAFLLCNPHNPVGPRLRPAPSSRRWPRPASGANCWIIADEIHCELLLDGRTHVPMASLSPEIEQRTITLMAPSKTFNLPD